MKVEDGSNSMRGDRSVSRVMAKEVLRPLDQNVVQIRLKIAFPDEDNEDVFTRKNIREDIPDSLFSVDEKTSSLGESRMAWDLVAKLEAKVDKLEADLSLERQLRKEDSILHLEQINEMERLITFARTEKVNDEVQRSQRSWSEHQKSWQTWNSTPGSPGHSISGVSFEKRFSLGKWWNDDIVKEVDESSLLTESDSPSLSAAANGNGLLSTNTKTFQIFGSDSTVGLEEAEGEVLRSINDIIKVDTMSPGPTDPQHHPIICINSLEFEGGGEGDNHVFSQDLSVDEKNNLYYAGSLNESTSRIPPVAVTLPTSGGPTVDALPYTSSEYFSPPHSKILGGPATGGNFSPPPILTDLSSPPLRKSDDHATNNSSTNEERTHMAGPVTPEFNHPTFSFPYSEVSGASNEIDRGSGSVGMQTPLFNHRQELQSSISSILQGSGIQVGSSTSLIGSSESGKTEDRIPFIHKESTPSFQRPMDVAGAHSPLNDQNLKMGHPSPVYAIHEEAEEIEVEEIEEGKAE